MAAIKQQVLAHFACSSVAALKKNRNFQLAMTGDTVAFKTKDDWLKLYRRFIGIPLNERNLANGPTVINGIDVLQHFRPWVVFGLDPKTASADDVRASFRQLIQPHHPDHGGDPADQQQGAGQLLESEAGQLLLSQQGIAAVARDLRVNSRITTCLIAAAGQI